MQFLESVQWLKGTPARNDRRASAGRRQVLPGAAVITGPPHFALASEASGQREYLKKMPRRTLATLGGAACGESASRLDPAR
jgi:hypothetical protein